jgi:hypothetical protein
VRLCPFADVVYGCDGPWWKNKQGLPDFDGVKLAHDTAVCATYRDVHKIEVEDCDKLLFDKPGHIGSGGNSGFQALNLALQFGVRRVLLIGFDFHGANGAHWYGPNVGPGMRNPMDLNYARWRSALASQAPVVAGMGAEIVNASSESALTCFEKASVEETLKRWAL